MSLKEKFLKYVSFDTQSDEDSLTAPSSEKQKLLGQYLVEELKQYGVDNAYLDEYGYVYGKIPSNTNSDYYWINCTYGYISRCKWIKC